MLEQNDLQSIGELLDKKLKTQKDEIVAEMGEVTSEAFSGVESRLGMLESKVDKVETKVDNLSKEMADRPTKTEIFNWADRRVVDLALRADRHDYLHINELDKLPPQPEISRALAERGLKRK